MHLEDKLKEIYLKSKVGWHLDILCSMERLSVNCRKPIRRKENSFRSQWEPIVKPTKLLTARENVGDKVVSGFSLASDWLRDGREFSGPITAISRQHSIENCSNGCNAVSLGAIVWFCHVALWCCVTRANTSRERDKLFSRLSFWK